MSDEKCNEEKEHRWLSRARSLADEAVARALGGIVHGTNSRRAPSIGNILTLIAMFGGVIGFTAYVSAESGKIQTQVTILKERQDADRNELKNEIVEIKHDVKQIQRDIGKLLGAVERIGGRMDERDVREGR